MKYIFKILKKLTIPIILLVIMLFFQANCDLSLPEYTANIINVGIQQNGIASTIPDVITEKAFNIMTTIDQSNLINNSYELLNKDSMEESEYNRYLKKYPLLEMESLYIKKEIDADTENILEEKIIKPYLISTAIVYNYDEFSALSNLPKEEFLNILFGNSQEKEVLLDNIEQSFSSVDSSFLKQYVISSIKLEYETIGINLNHYQINYIVKNGLTMLLIASTGMLIAVSVGFLVSRSSTKFSYMLREKVMKHVMNFSSKEYKEFSIASLITRATNDIQQIQLLFMMFVRVVIFSPILGFGALLKIWGNSMSWIIALGIAVVIVLIIILFVFAIPKFKIIQSLVDKLNLVTREILTGLPVIRAFSTEEHEEQRLDVANTELSKTNLFINRIMGLMSPAMSLLMNGLSILIIWVGAKQVDLGNLQVGTLLSFIVYTMQVVSSFLMLSVVSIVLPRAWISVKRVAEILDTDASIKNPQKTLTFDDNKKGEIEFKNVYFKYPDADLYVLEDINFTIKKGTTTAFIGSTGSGKSTIINLIMRFFDVSKGKILVDGRNIKDVTLKDLRSKIGYVPQKGALFTGTIASNIKFGDENISTKQMKKAANIAQALDFIEDKKKKYNSEVTQGGTNLSGGQKQRLSIARAIAIDPEFYIFDDSFSALDFKTDAALRKALISENNGATILIVAQRISTIMNADEIIVLNEGKIVGKGKHKDLLKTCDVYKEIAFSQLREEEL